MPTETKDTTRLEAFSDGVFAIAVTLLVLDLKVPDLELDTVTDPQLRERLLRQWPAYAGFLSSFLTILIIWVNHHYLFKLIHRADRTFMFTNGLLLLIVTFIPFPTSLLSKYILTPAAPTAAFIYASTYFALSIAFNLIWYSATRRGFLTNAANNQANFGGIQRGYFIGPALYGVAAVLSLFFPLVSVAVCLGLAIYFSILYYER